MDFSRFDRINQRIFRKITKSDKDKRILVYHPRFSKFLSAITDVRQFQDSFDGIQPFTDDFEITTNICHTFLIPPSIPVLKHIANCRKVCGEKGIKPHVQIWFQPHINEYIKAFMVDTGLAPKTIVNSFPSEENPASSKGAQPNENISVFDLGIDLVALDKDVLSMGDPYSFLHGFSAPQDLTIVSDFRRALDSVIQAFGGFLSIHAFGSLSSSISRTLPPPNGDYQTHLILIDRTADLLTPLITQMGYEGLIAEYFGIDYATVEIPSTNGKDTQLELLSSKEDPLFSALCCLNHQEATAEIQRRTSTVNSSFKPSENTGNLSENLEKFRGQSKLAIENKTLVDHLHIAQLILDKMKQSPYLRTLINLEAEALVGNGKMRETYTSFLEEGAPLPETLRVACLEYLLRGSISDYPGFVRMLTVNFGFEIYPLINFDLSSTIVFPRAL